jgi:RNA polymerase sigma-70 factor (ECF subfamily)
MSMLRSLSAALPAIDARTIRDIEQEIADELDFHIEMRTLDNMRSGMQPEAARAAAATQFGDFERIQRQCRQTLLGERLMLQKLQTVLTVVLLAAVAWLAYQVHAGQRATESALADFAAAVKQLTERPSQSIPPQAELPSPAHDWRTDRPVVVATFPETGATDVDPSISEIRVTFSKGMTDRSWSWVRSSEHDFPEGAGEIYYLNDGKTCVMPVKLRPGTKYVVWFNTANYQNFKDREGRPAEPYLLTFTTRQ